MNAPVGRPARPRRWLRLVAPLGVVLTLITTTAVTYTLQQPDVTDRAYLSPDSAAAVGGSRLADRLARRGVPVQRRTRTSEALVEAAKGDTTLFIPAPALVHPFYLRMIKLLPASTSVVLVAADRQVLRDGRLPATVAADRLAARAVAPGCGYRPAVLAGTAGVYRTRYRSGDALQRCYGGAVTVIRRGSAAVTLVGADDPFRNDRIGEHHNAELATALLAGAPRVIWLDLHHPEARPGYIDDPAVADQPPAPPSLGPGSPDPDFPLPDTRDDAPQPGPGGGETDTPVASEANPVWQAFPPWVFAAASLATLAMLLLALAAGRRQGDPVAEPLPVLVRTTETVEGRGRLYQRARARGAAAATLRETARGRLAHLMDLPAGTSGAALVAAGARHSGWPEPAVAHALDGPEPADDRELVEAAATIESLLQAVTHRMPPPNVPPEGEQR